MVVESLIVYQLKENQAVSEAVVGRLKASLNLSALRPGSAGRAAAVVTPPRTGATAVQPEPEKTPLQDGGAGAGAGGASAMDEVREVDGNASTQAILQAARRDVTPQAILPSACDSWVYFERVCF